MTPFIPRFVCLAHLLLSGALTLALPGLAGDWPQWLGPDRNAVSMETGLMQEWPREGPPLAWKTSGLGAGMGGVAISRGRVYTTGDDADMSAWLLALDERDGTLLWKAPIGRGGNPGNFVRPHGPRGTPAMDGDRLYILSQRGELVCFTLEGREVWRTDFVNELGGVMPVWGYAESPQVDGARIICTPGGARGHRDGAGQTDRQARLEMCRAQGRRRHPGPSRPLGHSVRLARGHYLRGPTPVSATDRGRSGWHFRRRTTALAV